MRQNAYAKDMATGSATAMETVEEFNRTPCDEIRRGTCCTFNAAAFSDAACGDNTWQVDGITYKKTCHIRRGVSNFTPPTIGFACRSSWFCLFYSYQFSQPIPL